MLIEGQCPDCKSALEIPQYNAYCPHCDFSAQKGSGSIGEFSERELDALVRLAAHAGKVILIYASLRGIPETNTANITKHPSFRRSEYLRLLSYYRAIMNSC